jgi:hypothetical protein
MSAADRSWVVRQLGICLMRAQIGIRVHVVAGHRMVVCSMAGEKIYVFPGAVLEEPTPGRVHDVRSDLDQGDITARFRLPQVWRLTSSAGQGAWQVSSLGQRDLLVLLAHLSLPVWFIAATQ